MSELKPCPFCGGEARLYPSEAGFFVGCFNDGCVVNPCSGEFVYDGVWDEEQKEAAIKEWNTRAERTCKMRRDEYGEWHCSECERGADKLTGSDGIVEWCDSWAPNYCPDCGARVVE